MIDTPAPAPLSTLAEKVEDFARARVLCIGDVMLDRFVYGSVSRISPEAPIPVITREREQTMLGGSGNVVRNIVSLGAQSCFISVVGDDVIGKQLLGLIGDEPSVEPYLLTENGRTTTEKTRFVSGTQQLLRCDNETRQPVTQATAERICQIAGQELSHYHALLLSDYGKGVLQPAVLRTLIDKANTCNIPVFVDPKQRDFSVYHGAFLLSPNLHELALVAGVESFDSDEAIVSAARTLIHAHQLQYMLVTRGKDGMTLVSAAGEALHIPAQAREVFDVSGAGDTVIATLTTAFASGVTIEDAARIANIAAGIVVGRMGTATIYRTDIKTALFTHETLSSQAKVMPQLIATDAVANWKRQKLAVGFTNGCFDILHVGHLQSLRDAKSHCDRLIVGINSDESVKRLKGESRPLNKEMDRAMLLAALDCVDLVVIFREDTPLKLLELLTPDILMKGADYTKEQVVGGSFVESYGGRVVLLPLREGYSSTQLIQKAKIAH